jgi:hypothetical protein
MVKYQSEGTMKKHALIILGVILFAQLALAQNPTPQTALKPAAPQQDELRFDLDFPGGTPVELIRAIEKASGQSLNVIVHDDSASVQLPALKMRNASLPDFFMALGESTTRRVKVAGGGSSLVPLFHFQSMGRGKDAVWYFYTNKTEEPPSICRYYQLADYLDEYSVEDITTAIQTGWKLLNVAPQPQLKFHRETKLLIAVGPPEQLQTIDSVLMELRKSHAPPKESRPAPKGEPSPEKK